MTAERALPCTPATGSVPHHVVFCNVEISPGVGSSRPCDLVATQGGVEAVFVMGLLWGLLIGCVCGLAMRRRRNRLNFDLSCGSQL